MLPVDPDGAVIPNIGWDPAKLSLIDATSGAALTVDTASMVLRYTSGQAFQGATGPATIVLDGFSITSATDPAPWRSSGARRSTLTASRCPTC